MKIFQRLARLVRREATVDWGTLRAVEYFNTQCHPIEGRPAVPEDVANGLVCVRRYYERVTKEELARIAQVSRRSVQSPARCK